jgi:hypothetical protein
VVTSKPVAVHVGVTSQEAMFREESRMVSPDRGMTSGETHQAGSQGVTVPNLTHPWPTFNMGQDERGILPLIQSQEVQSNVIFGLERAKARCKWSTTHGPSCKEVMVITSPPTHWPDKLVVGLLNSYLGTHGRAIQAVTETQNHLGGLALMCGVLLVKADIQVMHAYFDAVVKRIHEDDTTKTQVEVGSSKSFLCIPDFPYFGAKLPMTQWRTSRSRRFSLPPNGRTTFTCTRGLCLAWSGTPTSQTPVQCSLTFTILEVVITSKATLLSPYNLLKSRLGSPSALGVGDMATVPWCALQVPVVRHLCWTPPVQTSPSPWCMLQSAAQGKTSAGGNPGRSPLPTPSVLCQLWSQPQFQQQHLLFLEALL